MRVEEQLRFRTLPDGTPAAVLDTPVPEDAHPIVREGFARRALVNAGGTCPCGAALVMPNRATRRAARQRGEALWVRVEHENGCPATTENLIAAMREERA